VQLLELAQLGLQAVEGRTQLHHVRLVDLVELVGRAAGTLVGNEVLDAARGRAGHELEVAQNGVQTARKHAEMHVVELDLDILVQA